MMSLRCFGPNRFVHPPWPEHFLSRELASVHATRLLTSLPSVALGVIVAIVALGAAASPATVAGVLDRTKKHTFDQPGKYRVTLIVWDAAGRGARAERTVEVLPAK